QMATAAVLAVVTLTGAVNVWWVLLASFVGAVFLAVDNPTRNALLPELVPREDLLSGAALNGASYTGAALIGPALGGMLLPLLAPAGLFLLNAASFLGVLIPLFLIRDIHSKPRQEPVSVSDSLRQVQHYVKTTSTVGLLLGLSAVVGLLGRSYLPLTPAFARDLLHADERGLGLLYAAPGLGALLAAGLLAGRRVVRVEQRLLIGTVLGFAGLLVVYSFNPWLPVALLLLVGTGLTSQVAATMISTGLQLQIPGAMRGRVLALYSITIIGFASLGALGTGALAERTGPGVAVTISAILMAGAALFVAPRLTELDALNPDSPG
ncbi:MAG TPA: MFS transporter, partial [Chloroflexia bacterium]|nr:MFS transporter [Chloroflexia bacterium]